MSGQLLLEFNRTAALALLERAHAKLVGRGLTLAVLAGFGVGGVEGRRVRGGEGGAAADLNVGAVEEVLKQTAVPGPAEHVHTIRGVCRCGDHLVVVVSRAVKITVATFVGPGARGLVGVTAHVVEGTVFVFAPVVHVVDGDEGEAGEAVLVVVAIDADGKGLTAADDDAGVVRVDVGSEVGGGACLLAVVLGGTLGVLGDWEGEGDGLMCGCGGEQQGGEQEQGGGEGVEGHCWYVCLCWLYGEKLGECVGEERKTEGRRAAFKGEDRRRAEQRTDRERGGGDL